MKSLQDKVALITGATRGIGRGIALEFAHQGANVAFTYVTADSTADALVSELEVLGVKALAFYADASDFKVAQTVLDSIVAEWGRIDILVNNAGITQDNLLLRMTEEQWDAVQTVNLKSVFNYTKAAAKQMLRQKSGSIINLSSIVGVVGNPGQANYAASKAGIIGFTKSIAQELGSRNIRCNAVAPGFITTEMTQAIPQAELENWLKKMEEIKKIKFKVIIIDYINILKNWRNPNSENTYMKIKQIAEDLRAMAMRNDWCVITATQINRSGFNSTDISDINIAESSGLGHTADAMFGIIQDELMYIQKEYLLKLLANRNEGYKNTKKRFIIDYNYMKISEDLNSNIIEDFN
ncbi:MAG: SDR family NAD(P)-dependent oxidoreductase [Bacteroidia bacterium]|nr:SDR family NAD(P)-dependent oxidoreductase [Bacteroidia bacterium]